MPEIRIEVSEEDLQRFQAAAAEEDMNVEGFAYKLLRLRYLTSVTGRREERRRLESERYERERLKQQALERDSKLREHIERTREEISNFKPPEGPTMREILERLQGIEERLNRLEEQGE